MKNVHLLIIDPQVDFCDPSGSLFVPGADDDMKRLAAMINCVGDNISNIHVTLDSHHFVDVAHPAFWRDENFKKPDPFTIISSKDVVDGKWVPFNNSLRKRMIDYTKSLEDNGQFLLCIWPPHCLIGSQGHCVYPELFESLLAWQEFRPWNVDYVTKGSNIYTEHYGAVASEVPDPTDVTTQINTRIIDVLMKADEILVAGEAGSHCLKTTVEQIADGFGNDEYVKKITLLIDATSPVISPAVNFPAIQDKFIEDMKLRGMKTSTTEEVSKSLK